VECWAKFGANSGPGEHGGIGQCTKEAGWR
jgi:hypothetical protein